MQEMTMANSVAEPLVPEHGGKYYLRGLLLFLAALALWVGGIVGGFACLYEYATTPGGSQPSSSRWPANSALVPDPDRANLVLLAHPRCPCSRATMDELERLTARTDKLLMVHAVFYRPVGSAEDWAKTDLWSRATRLPEARVYDDVDGVEARLFGATTSGYVVLFDADGRMLFSGGITESRGHTGPSVGTDAILSLVTKGIADQNRTPVFGCPLSGPCSPEREGN